MNKQKITIISNPISGKGESLNVAIKMHKILKLNGFEVKIKNTRGQGDAKTLASEAVQDGAESIIGCGGDGTIHEIINGISTINPKHSKPKLGIIPTGRCNNLAKELKLDNNLNKLSQLIINSQYNAIDLGKVNETLFATVAALGFDSKVAEYVDNGNHPKFLTGTLSYLYGIFAVLFKFNCPKVSIRGDFGSYTGNIFLVASGNTPDYGGDFKITPNAKIDDGILNICIVKNISKIKALFLLPRVFFGTHVKHPKAIYEPSKSLSISSENTISIWADGEYVGTTPATISILPKTLKVYSTRYS